MQNELTSLSELKIILMTIIIIIITEMFMNKFLLKIK